MTNVTMRCDAGPARAISQGHLVAFRGYLERENSVDIRN